MLCPARRANRISFEALQSNTHTDLLIIYMCWRLRHVAIQPCQVTGLSTITSFLAELFRECVSRIFKATQRQGIFEH